MSEQIIDWVARYEKTWGEMKERLENRGIHRIDIWNGNAPEHPLKNGFAAGLYLLPVQEGTPRGTIIVCAGGAFKFKNPNEAEPVAEFFHKLGMNAAILDYTVDSRYNYGTVEAYPAMTAARNDALQAIRYLRANAIKLGILPDKIAISGFSAGGRTAQSAAVFFDNGDPASDDPMKKVSSRPDACLLFYGAMSDCLRMDVLLLDHENLHLRAMNDPLTNMRPDTPPTFIFQTISDDPRWALTYALALANRGVECEVHTFAEGHHGEGMYNNVPYTAKWADLAGQWLGHLNF